MPDIETDVAVVGAGPAGAIAAHQLASDGLRTVILEKSRIPRYKTCGGGVVRRVASLLPVDLQDSVERTCHLAELNEFHSGLRFRVRRPHPLVYMTMRARFDELLVSAACKAGASLIHPCEVRDLSPTPECVELVTTQGTVRARYLISAEGAGGGLARRAGWTANPATVPALEWEISVPRSTFERFAQVARFDLGFPDGGYAWVFPKSEHLSVGLLAFRRDGVRLKQALEEYLTRLGLGQARQMERHGFLIPVRPRPGGAVRGRVLLVGDAAGLADPVTCEGISHAVVSGRLAARAVSANGLEDPARVASLYRRSLAREVLAELRIARWPARVCFYHPHLRHWLLATLGQPVAEALVEVFSGTRTYRELVLNPRSYFKLARHAFHSLLAGLLRSGEEPHGSPGAAGAGARPRIEEDRSR